MAGSREILAAAWLRWSREWYLYALKLTQNGADAEDAVSEALYRTIRVDPLFASTRHARNYVARAIKSVVVAKHQKRRRRRRLLEELGRSEARERQPTFDALVVAEESGGIKCVIEAALTAMDGVLREALELYYDPRRKTTFREVAEAQDVSVRTAHKRVQSALDLIARAIEGDLEA